MRNDVGIPSWKPFLFGGIASITAELGTFPIDTTKTRLQVQGQHSCEAHLKEIRYQGMIHAFCKISKEEGVRALYSGIKAAVLRQSSYGTIKIGCYHTLKRLLVPNPANDSLPTNVLCGVCSGVISSTVANPTDVVKIRMQAQQASFSGNANNGGIIVSFLTIYHQEGTRGLWRGVSPTAQRAAIIAGVQLPAYDWVKTAIINHQIMGDTVATHFVSSIVAGLAACVASNPVDVAKTRMMNQKQLKVHLQKACQSRRIYKNTVDCLFKTATTEGFLALYKGFIPSWLRMGPWNIIFFLTYEQLKKLNTVLTHSDERWC